MKKIIMIVGIVLLILTVILLPWMMRALILEQINKSPNHLIVTELISQNVLDNIGSASTNRVFTVEQAQNRHLIYESLTAGRATVSSPADAPNSFIVQTVMKNGNTSSFRIWIDPQSERAWVSDSLESLDEVDSTSDTNPSDPNNNPTDAYLLTEPATRSLLDQSAFQSIYLTSLWPQCAYLQTAESTDTVSLYADHIDISFTPPNKNKPVNFVRTHTEQPPAIVTITDLNKLALIPPESADSFDLKYYPLSINDLTSAAAGTFDLTGQQPIQPQQSGHYMAVYTLTYGSKNTLYRGSVRGSFLMNLATGIVPHTAYSSYQQGTVGCIALSHIGPTETHSYMLRIPYLDQDIPFVPAEGSAAAYFPIGNSVKPGRYTAQILVQASVPSPQGLLASPWQEIASIEYTVDKKIFTRQDLSATSEMTSLTTPENYRTDNEMVTAAKAQSHPEPYWQGNFIMPLSGRISTYYGEERYTNGIFANYHSGMDIAAEADVPVGAAAAGKVVMAYPLKISGNTVIIDHGAGIFTSYSHLNAYHVKEGDMVKAGDIIGLIGSTGYSTGPHLHFTVSHRMTTFDPMWLMEQDVWGKALKLAQESD